MSILTILFMLAPVLDTFTARLLIHFSDSPGIIVTEKSWRKTRFRPGWDRFEEPANNSNRNRPRRPPRVIEGYTYKAKIKNKSEKTIVVVGWDYTFRHSEDEKPTHHQFFSRTKIEPGKEKTVSSFVAAPPTRTVSASSAGRDMIEEVIINYIKYEDGSVWKKVSDEPAPKEN